MKFPFITDINLIGKHEQPTTTPTALVVVNQPLTEQQVIQSTVDTPNAIQLATGEYVDRATYEALSVEDQALLTQTGTKVFNETREARSVAESQRLQQELDKTTVLLFSGERVSRINFDTLDKESQSQLLTLGTVGFNAKQAQLASESQAALQEFQSKNSQSNSGEWFNNQWLNELSTEARSILILQGAAAFEDWSQGKTIAQTYANSEWKPDYNKLNPYEGKPSWYDRVSAAGFIPTVEQAIPPSQLAAGVTISAYPTDIGRKVFEEMKAAGQLPADAKYVSYNPMSGQLTSEYIPKPTETVKSLPKPVIIQPEVTEDVILGPPIPRTTTDFPMRQVITSITGFLTRPFTEQQRLSKLSQAELQDLYQKQEEAPIVKKLFSTSGYKVTKDTDGNYGIMIMGTAPVPIVGVGGIGAAALSTSEIIAILGAFIIATGTAYLNKDKVASVVEDFRNSIGRNPTLDEVKVVEDVSGNVSEFRLTPASTATGLETMPLEAPGRFTIPVFPLAQEGGAIITTSPLEAPTVFKGMGMTTVPITAPALPKLGGTTVLPLEKPTILVTTATAPRTVAIDWDRVLEDAQTRVGRTLPQKEFGAEEVTTTGLIANRGIHAATLTLLDQEIVERYRSGQLSDSELATYNEARQHYMQSKGIVESDVQSIPSTFPQTSSDATAIAAMMAAELAIAHVRTLTDTRILTDAAIQAIREVAIQVYTDAITQGQTSTVAQTMANTAAQNAVETLTTAAIEATEQIQAQEQTQTQTRAQAMARENVRAQTTTAAIAIPIPLAAAMEASEADRKKIIGMRGVLEWRHGIFWKVYPPPYDKVYHFRHPLPGTYKFSTGPGSAYRTIQVIGGNPPEDIDLDIGIAIAHLKRVGKEVTIEFSRDADDVYKGKSVRERIPHIPTYRKSPASFKSLLSDRQFRHKMTKPEPQHRAIDNDPFSRYYMGRKLRPVELKTTL